MLSRLFLEVGDGDEAADRAHVHPVGIALMGEHKPGDTKDKRTQKISNTYQNNHKSRVNEACLLVEAVEEEG